MMVIIIFWSAFLLMFRAIGDVFQQELKIRFSLLIAFYEHRCVERCLSVGYRRGEVELCLIVCDPVVYCICTVVAICYSLFVQFPVVWW